MTTLAASQARPGAALRGALRIIPIWVLVVPPAIAVIGAWRGHLEGDLLDLVVAAGAAAGQGWILVDPAAVTVAASPTSSWWRAAHRAAVGVPLAVGGWVLGRVVVVAAGRSMAPADDPPSWWPPAPAWWAFAALLLTVLATEAGAVRRGAAPGVSGIGVVFAALVLATRLPEPLEVLPLAEHTLVWVIATVGAGLLLARRLRDPGRTRTVTRR